MVVVVGTGVALLAPKAPRDYEVEWFLGGLSDGLHELDIEIRTEAGAGLARSVYRFPPAATREHQRLRLPPGTYRAELTFDYGSKTLVRSQQLQLADQDVITLEP